MPYKHGGIGEKLAKMRKNLIARAKTVGKQIELGKFDIGDIATARRMQEQYLQQASELYASYYEDGKRKIKSQRELEYLVEKGERSLQTAIDLTSTRNRQNFLTQKEINMTSSPYTREFSRYTKEQVSRFYKLTEPIWNIKDANGNPVKRNRNEMIMDYLGVDSLEDAFRLVLEAGDAYAELNAAGFYKDDIFVENESAPELGEPEGATEEHSYSEDIVGFSISDFAAIIKKVRSVENS